MTADQRVIAIGAYINSALYCAGVFVAGLLTGNPLAWRLALVTAGANFLCYFAQMGCYCLLRAQARAFAVASLSALTIFIGLCAGVALL